ncbi:hypothetical protein PPUJ20066_38370 [Pseudomonas putida]|nr:hypothetical protein CR512_11995 [Pseudomonas putida]GLO57801.1 hypothetical protein PPUJ20066_38370 [Pseudomonas putida]
MEQITAIARDVALQILNGGKNYFICADFSPSRIEKTKMLFFDTARNKNISEKAVNAIKAFGEVLEGITDSVSTASFVIRSIASRLYLLTMDDFRTPITMEIVELLSELEPHALETGLHEFEWKETWLEANSEWDKYVISLMDGIIETPYLSFTKINNFLSQLDFLRDWKAHLGKEKFSIIQDFIKTEGHHELDIANPTAAAKLNKLIDTL